MAAPFEEPAFVSLGKQVLKRDGTHYADACDMRAAEMIAAALNRQARLIDEIVDDLMAFEASEFAVPRPSGEGWQSIETAPAGQWLLLFCPGDVAWQTHPHILGKKLRRQWHDEEGYPVHPTHFCAIPPAPDSTVKAS